MSKKKRSPTKFDPNTTREKIAAYLEKPAKAAMDARKYGKAIPIYRALVAALGPGSTAEFELGMAWLAAGKQREAIAAFQSYIEHGSNAALLKRAHSQVARQKHRTIRFTDENFSLSSSPRLAKQAFDRGRRAFRSKHYADALIYYQMGYAMAPDAAGFLREIGATYDKLGAKDERTKWYVQYLQRRPFGRNADMIRRQLKKEKKALGTLTVKSPFKCELFFVEGMRAPKMPTKMPFAPGTYTSLCINRQYQIGYWEDFKVKAGESQEVKLAWAVVVNGLKKPYGRIVLEDARQQGIMQDLGISSPEVGVVAPTDGRALKMILKADDGSRQEERYLRLQPGAREVVKW